MLKDSCQGSAAGTKVVHAHVSPPAGCQASRLYRYEHFQQIKNSPKKGPNGTKRLLSEKEKEHFQHVQKKDQKGQTVQKDSCQYDVGTEVNTLQIVKSAGIEFKIRHMYCILIE